MIRAVLAFCSLLTLTPEVCHARATFRITEHGAGFNDNTPTTPVGGNEGKTVGEQRHLALAYAFEQWSGLLDSSVPIDVDVEFSSLGCEGGITLGQAGAAGYVSGIEAPGVNPEILYPIALANSLAGEDLAAASPDIYVTLNTAPDDLCRSRTGGFYYGFDGKAGDANDLVELVLHEFAHGLGFVSTVDKETGELFEHIDPFSAQLFDLDENLPWAQLSPAERARSTANPRRLVWTGAAAARVAASVLTYDQPVVTFEPRVPEWSGMVSDTNFGQAASMMGVTGPVILGRGCDIIKPEAEGPWIALFTQCGPVAAAGTAAEAGAAGAFLSFDFGLLPPSPVESAVVTTPYALPLVVLSPSDARNVQTTLARQPLFATIAADPSHRLGTDARGRPLMFASNPVREGSTLSHVDPSMRPNQIMEPTATPNATHNLALTRAFLQDIGWSARCGDGNVDPTEECDDGVENNSKLEPGGCRKDCLRAHCGDGVRDQGEDCDDGLNNSATRANACRRNCKHALCGDGVVDDKEQCDDGKGNDDEQRGGCRTSCRFAHCGDGVVDALEQCDDGDKNNNSRADACRKDCRTPRCGDGAVDKGEQCDLGKDNGDPEVSACRSDCTQPICGDGVVDQGEHCDGSKNCSATCQPERTEPAPSVPEDSDRDAAMPDAAELGEQRTQAQAASSSDGAGCGCRITPGEQRASGTSLLVLGVGAVWLHLRRRQRTRSGVSRSEPSNPSSN